ncbi:MAG: hypothetical protein ACRDST_11005, partial [Pseudonocardiaceae bacterium]
VDGKVLGDTFHLSADYVKADVSLAYSSTQHTAQGRTVDTGHSIAGPGVNAEGLYVGATRGEQENTIWTVTQAVPTDAAPGQTPEVQTRSARAVVSDILEGARRDPSALRQQADAQTAAVSTLKHGDQLISVAAEATAGRTSALLDRLAAQGVLPPSHREALAADDSTWSLERLLRTAEIGGHDPAEVLAAAVSERDLDGARHPAQVLYARIENRLRAELTPTVSSYQDLIPRDLPEEWRPWATARAQAADQRRQQLGEQIATEAPQWAVEALGAPPQDQTARAEWADRVGWAASCRELMGHTDQTDPLGAAPPAALAEKHAIWRTAHAKLDLPDAGADEHSLSDGQLRVRVRAWERERLWAPRYVADELAATIQAVARAHRDATIWAQRAAATTESEHAEKLRAEAATARVTARALAQQVAQLEVADEIQARWYTHTAPTRNAAERARVVLGKRGIDLNEPAEKVSAQEWLDAHREADAAEDPHRKICDESELSDTGWERVRAEADRLADPSTHHVETAVADIRDTAEPDAAEYADPNQPGGLLSADQSAAAVDRARQAVAEVETRRRYDQSREADDALRNEQLTVRWTGHGRAAERIDADRHNALTDELD